MHIDRIRTDAISKSMLQVLHVYCRAVPCGEMYCIGYSLFDNLVCITACLYMYCMCSTVLIIVYTYSISRITPIYKEWLHLYYTAR